MSRAPITERVTTAAKGDVVVFLIGMRINRWRTLRHWLPVFTGMTRMLRELSRDKSLGMLECRAYTAGPRTYSVVQYWSSSTGSRARSCSPTHRPRSSDTTPACAAFNRRTRDAKGAVGIWHETYIVPAGSYEAVYHGMPPFGLGEAHGVEPVARRGERAAQRLAG